ADCGVNVWDTCTGSAFLELDRLLPEEHQSSQLRGHFPQPDTPTNSLFISGSRFSAQRTGNRNAGMSARESQTLVNFAPALARRLPGRGADGFRYRTSGSAWAPRC